VEEGTVFHPRRPAGIVSGTVVDVLSDIQPGPPNDIYFFPEILVQEGAPRRVVDASNTVGQIRRAEQEAGMGTGLGIHAQDFFILANPPLDRSPGNELGIEEFHFRLRHGYTPRLLIRRFYALS
jgi:hypothetical protein